MELISDVLLLAASLGAALYCQVLARRLRRFTALESGMGGAIAVLSAQVDDMTRALEQARGVAGGAEKRLVTLTGQAEALARRLELMVAALHDLPEPAASGDAGVAIRMDVARAAAQSATAAAAAAVTQAAANQRRPRFLRRRATPAAAASQMEPAE